MNISSSKFACIIIFLFFLNNVDAMDVQNGDLDGLQILINPQADWFKFKAVVNGNIIHDLVTPRPAGSTFKEKCLVFPKNTINIHQQQSFLYDKHGKLLTKEDSIGLWKCIGKALVETSLAQIPPVGTCFEESTWNFIFRSNERTKIIAHGRHTVISNLQPGKQLVENELIITEKTENKELVGKRVHGKVHVAPDGQSFVIKVTFDKE